MKPLTAPTVPVITSLALDLVLTRCKGHTNSAGVGGRHILVGTFPLLVFSLKPITIWLPYSSDGRGTLPCGGVRLESRTICGGTKHDGIYET